MIHTSKTESIPCWKKWPHKTCYKPVIFRSYHTTLKRLVPSEEYTHGFISQLHVSPVWSLKQRNSAAEPPTAIYMNLQNLYASVSSDNKCWDVSVKGDQVYCKTACPHLIKDYTFCCYCNTCHKMTETNNVCPSRRFLISLTCLLHSAPGPFLPTAMGHRCLEFGQ